MRNGAAQRRQRAPHTLHVQWTSQMVLMEAKNLHMPGIKAKPVITITIMIGSAASRQAGKGRPCGLASCNHPPNEGTAVNNICAQPQVSQQLAAARKRGKASSTLL